MKTISLDSGTPAQCAKRWQEVEEVLGLSNDPLEILIAEEEQDGNPTPMQVGFQSKE